MSSGIAAQAAQPPGPAEVLRGGRLSIRRLRAFSMVLKGTRETFCRCPLETRCWTGWRLGESLVGRGDIFGVAARRSSAGSWMGSTRSTTLAGEVRSFRAPLPHHWVSERPCCRSGDRSLQFNGLAQLHRPRRLYAASWELARGIMMMPSITTPPTAEVACRFLARVPAQLT